MARQSACMAVSSAPTSRVPSAGCITTAGLQASTRQLLTRDAAKELHKHSKVGGAGHHAMAAPARHSVLHGQRGGRRSDEAALQPHAQPSMRRLRAYLCPDQYSTSRPSANAPVHP